MLGVPEGLPVAITEERARPPLPIMSDIRWIQGVEELSVPVEVIFRALIVSDTKLLWVLVQRGGMRRPLQRNRGRTASVGLCGTVRTGVAAAGTDQAALSNTDYNRHTSVSEVVQCLSWSVRGTLLHIQQEGAIAHTQCVGHLQPH